MIGFTIENTLERTVTSFESWDSEKYFMKMLKLVNMPNCDLI